MQKSLHHKHSRSYLHCSHKYEASLLTLAKQKCVPLQNQTLTNKRARHCMISRADIGQFVQQSDVSFVMIASSMTSRNNMMQFISCMTQYQLQIASFIVLPKKQVLSKPSHRFIHRSSQRCILVISGLN